MTSSAGLSNVVRYNGVFVIAGCHCNCNGNQVNKIDISFSCVCPVIDHEFRHNMNIVKVAEARADNRVDPQTTLAINSEE